MPVRHFGQIDIMEAVSIINAANVDFDNSYHHHTEHLQKWMKDNEDVVLEPPLAIADKKGGVMIHISPDPYFCRIKTDRPDTVTAMAQLINIIRPSTLSSIEYILKHVYHDFSLDKQ